MKYTAHYWKVERSGLHRHDKRVFEVESDVLAIVKAVFLGRGLSFVPDEVEVYEGNRCVLPTIAWTFSSPEV